MVNLLRVEWTKAVKNHLPLSFLVWIYPLGLGVLLPSGFGMVLWAAFSSVAVQTAVESR